MANKYEKIDFGTGQNTNTGDTIYDGFDKVNKAFDNIESDINEVVADVNEIINTEITNINNRIDAVVEDVNDVIDNEIANINVSISNLSNDLDQLSDKVETDLQNYYTIPQTDDLIANVGLLPNNATALGINSVASSANATAFGYGARATGASATAIGNGATASASGSVSLRGSATGLYSMSLSYQGVASGQYSTSIGWSTTAYSNSSLVIGRFNAQLPNENTTWTTGAPLFVAGNGASHSAKSNAYVLNNNGTSTQYGIANYGDDYSANFTDNSLVSKKYADIKFESVGIFPNQQTRIGLNSYTSHQWSSAFGFGAKATGRLGTAIGGGTEIGGNSVAIGCMNYSLTDSVIIGNELSATVDNVIMVGVGLFPQHRGEIILGRYNKIADNKVNVLNPSNHLFTIANGSSVSNRSNAYELFNNGSSIQYGIASYSDDFSANFTEHSLVDKKYVDENVASTVNTAISTILDGAPETFDTLKEIADWIENDGVSASELSESIALKVDKSEYNTFKTSTTAQINSNYTELDGRLTIVNNKVNDNYSTILGEIGTANGKINTLTGSINGHTGQINSLDSRLTTLNTTVNNNYNSLSAQIGPIDGRLNTLESKVTSLTTYVNTFYAKGEIDGMLLGLENRVNNKITVDISTQLNTNVYPRLTTVENKFSQYYTIQQTNTLLENAGIINKTANGAVYIKGRNIDNLTQLGVKAVDLSDSGNTTGYGAIGENSFVANSYTRANALNSSAFGQGTIANGAYSTVFGRSVQITGDGAFGSGRSNTGTGKYSAIFGQDNIGYSQSSLVIGQNNNPIVASTQTDWVVGAPLFIAGNGSTVANKSNAYVLYNNGSSTQNGIAFYGADYSANYTARSLVDKGYTDATYATIANMNTQINNAKFMGTYSRRATATSSVAFPTPNQNLMHTYNYGATGFVGGLNQFEGACWFGFYGNFQNFIKIRVEVHLMATEGHSIYLGDMSVHCEELTTISGGLYYPTLKHEFKYDYYMGAGGNTG